MTQSGFIVIQILSRLSSVYTVYKITTTLLSYKSMQPIVLQVSNEFSTLFDSTQYKLNTSVLPDAIRCVCVFVCVCVCVCMHVCM